MEKLTYTVSEAAEILGISKSYAYTMVKENRLPILKIGSRRLIPKVQLEQWINEQTVNTVMNEGRQ